MTRDLTPEVLCHKNDDRKIIQYRRKAVFPNWDKTRKALGGFKCLLLHRQPPPDIASEFDNLASKWLEETKFTSSTNTQVMHPAYQRIIGMGPAVLPHILARLQQAPENWFWALKAITGEDPVQDKDIGRPNAMRLTWLEWAHRRGLTW